MTHERGCTLYICTYLDRGSAIPSCKRVYTRSTTPCESSVSVCILATTTSCWFSVFSSVCRADWTLALQKLITTKPGLLAERVQCFRSCARCFPPPPSCGSVRATLLRARARCEILFEKKKKIHRVFWKVLARMGGMDVFRRTGDDQRVATSRFWIWWTDSRRESGQMEIFEPVSLRAVGCPSSNFLFIPERIVFFHILGKSVVFYILGFWKFNLFN